ncbi:Pectin lyase fold containing protein [Parasponia andersonii]|uniref:Pectin lyase fold containing protein n=1 Tax=Parasponia andersonii TaxID=3476 RepID=A0A2P5CAX7_PARAD|nr:Pectin lyase fold containing protein [Parasponia andersonii]
MFWAIDIYIDGLLQLFWGEYRPDQDLKNADDDQHKAAVRCTSRKHNALLTDFGGVGDRVSSNTKSFKAQLIISDGGAQLIVPPGKWLTGSFSLTGYFTLFLRKDVVILASQVCM